MSSKCNIILRELRNIKKEIILYKHDEGHPDVMVDSISQMLYDIHKEYKTYGDVDWFFDPSKVASKLIIKSVTKMPESLRSILPQLDHITRKRFELHSNVDIPTLNPEVSRISNCNYEYVITLKEELEPTVFRGYTLDVIRMNLNKKVQDVLSLDINLEPQDELEVGGDSEDE